ncbi:MAG: glycosyltransferase [Verrucomicrobiales bacterium]|nr:glycosyltransferase [Verrucomicrobiales bacterium]
MAGSSDKKVRPLLIAEGANPTLTSASLVGWSCASAIARKTNAHIVTHWRNRDDFLGAGLVEGEDFTAIDTRRIQNIAWKATRLLSPGDQFSWSLYAAFSNLVYPAFERALWDTLGDRIKSGEFDLVHRILPLSPTTPSPLARKLKAHGIPFLLGPLNGGVPWPKGFDQIRKEENDRGGSLRPFYRFLPGARAARKHSSGILVGSRATLREMPRSLHSKCIFLPENAIDTGRFPLTPRSPREPGPLRIAFVGRLVALKGVDMLIEAALPLLQEGRLELDVIGDGPARESLTRQLAGAGLDPAGILAGWVEHGSLQDRLSRADLFAFPSIREFGGGAVLEAMALGVSPVVLDHGGPPELVPPGAGHILPLDNRESIVSNLRQLFQQYLDDPSPLASLGKAAQEHIRDHLTWEAKTNQILEVYDWLLRPAHEGEAAAKPDWGTPLGWDR